MTALAAGGAARTILTPMGPVAIRASDAGVTAIWLGGDDVAGSPATPGALAHLDLLARELEAYFAGDLGEFASVLAQPGTEFQQRVWAALRLIPAGAKRSYADVARSIGRPAAVRAVARANATNHIPILVPCHRVIGSDGSLTGYAGGLERKQWLLDHEARHWGALPAAGAAVTGSLFAMR